MLTPLETVSREFLSDRVANILRKKVILGEMPKGLHLNETKLAEQLVVSRGSIRGAIQILEGEGLVYTPANGRTIVEGLSAGDVIGFFEARIALESHAIRTIVQSHLNKNVNQLEELLIEMKGADDIATNARLDVEFHYRIVQHSGNRTLLKLWSVLRGPTTTLIEISSDIIYDRLRSIPNVHSDIVRAIKAGKDKRAVKLLEQHLRAGAEIIASYLGERIKATETPVLSGV